MVATSYLQHLAAKKSDGGDQKRAKSVPTRLWLSLLDVNIDDGLVTWFPYKFVVAVRVYCGNMSV